MVMHDFSMLSDHRSAVRLKTQQQQPVVEKQEDEKYDVSNDDIDVNLAYVLPSNQQIKAKKLLHLLQSQGY